jgi:MFS family permease
MFAANGFVMGAWAPQIPLLLPRHQITEFTLGLLILALGLGAVGAMLFAGRLIAAFGSRRVASLFALAAVPCLPLVVFAPNLWLLTPAMALMGALIGCMDVAMNANAVEAERRLGRAIMSSSHGFWSLGGFVGGSAGSYVIAHSDAGTQALLAAAVALALVLGAMPFLIHDAAHAANDNAAPQEKSALLPRDLGLWVLGFMALFSMVPEGAVLDWAAIYLGKELGADLFRSGLGFAFFAGAMAIVRFAGDTVRNRFGAVRTLRASGLVGAAGLMGGALAPNDIVAIASFGVAGLGVANMVPIIFSAAGNHAGMAAGAAISTVTMVGYAGILVAPSTIGFVAEHIGFRTTYGALALVLMLVAALAGRVAAADGVRKA